MLNVTKKTSKGWLKLVPKEVGLEIMDPDGWDRSSPEAFDNSFEKEKITKIEFCDRTMNSTLQFKNLELFTKWAEE